MSVSLLEVLEDDGYNLATKEDAIWLLSRRNEFYELVERCEEVVEAIDNLRMEQEDE